MCFFTASYNRYLFLIYFSRDGLAIPTVSLTIFYLFSLIQAGVFETSFVSLASSSSSKASSSRTRRPTPNARPVPICEPTLTDRLLSTLFWLSLSGCVALFGLSLSASPPRNLPDLWPVLVSLYSAGHFVLYFGFSLVRQLLAPNNHKSVAIGKKRN